MRNLIAYSKKRNIFLSSLSAKDGFTLVELMVVTALFSAFFAMLLGVLTNSDQTWRLGQDRLVEQQEARKAMDNIARILKQSNPNWVVNGTPYPVTISAGNTRLDFYHPLFDASGSIETLKKNTYRLNPDNVQQLLKKEGAAGEQVVANDVSYLNFGGGCSGCGSLNCTNIANDCPVVNIEVRTRKKNEFPLVSQVTLRNQNITPAGNLTIEQ
jgi:prepilin-type N-terminal cleavage/methylation domain-containing protein